MITKHSAGDRMKERAVHPELLDAALLDDAALRIGRSGQALFEYFSRLEALRNIVDELGHDALAERAARAELHTRVVLSAGLDALNELHDLGLIQQSMRAAIKSPALISSSTPADSIRRAGAVLSKRFPQQVWDWMEGASKLLADVAVHAESSGGELRAMLTRNGHETIVSLSPEAGPRVDTRAFFAAGPDRIYTPTSAASSPAQELTKTISAYDGAITGLAFAREWVYRHARNADELGAPAHTGAGPAALVVALIVAGAVLVVVAGIQFYICKKENDETACKWAEILSIVGLALLAGGTGGGTSRSSSGTDPAFQYGTNPQ
jgi:hypothetical protein